MYGRHGRTSPRRASPSRDRQSQPRDYEQGSYHNMLSSASDPRQRGSVSPVRPFNQQEHYSPHAMHDRIANNRPTTNHNNRQGSIPGRSPPTSTSYEHAHEQDNQPRMQQRDPQYRSNTQVDAYPPYPMNGGCSDGEYCNDYDGHQQQHVRQPLQHREERHRPAPPHGAHGHHEDDEEDCIVRVLQDLAKQLKQPNASPRGSSKTKPAGVVQVVGDSKVRVDPNARHCDLCDLSYNIQIAAQHFEGRRHRQHLQRLVHLRQYDKLEEEAYLARQAGCLVTEDLYGPFAGNGRGDSPPPQSSCPAIQLDGALTSELRRIGDGRGSWSRVARGLVALVSSLEDAPPRRRDSSPPGRANAAPQPGSTALDKATAVLHAGGRPRY